MVTSRPGTDATRELSGSDLLVTEAPTQVARKPRAATFDFGAVEGTPEQFGPYHVYDELGIGGMASVHRAELHGADGFKKPIALKRMLGHVAADPGAAKSFLEEARLASRLQHPNIAQAYDAGTIAGTHFIAMELVPGPTLKQILVQCSAAAGAIPVQIVVEILIQLCEALDYAHTLKDEKGRPLGIVHRDVSPANIIVSGAGVVKLIDFGIAKVQLRNEATQAGVIKGKLGYVAPEYIGGRLDARADLFSLGVCAHEMLCGRRLFGGTNDLMILNAVRERAIPKPSRINPQVTPVLDDIVLTALQRDPNQRWQSTRAMCTALQGVARELGTGISNRALRDWVEWAFTQDEKGSVEILQLVEKIEEQLEVSQQREVEEALRPPEAVPAKARVQYPEARHEPLFLRLVPWVILFGFVAFAAAGIWFAYKAPRPDAIAADLST